MTRSDPADPAMLPPAGHSCSIRPPASTRIPMVLAPVHVQTRRPSGTSMHDARTQPGTVASRAVSATTTAGLRPAAQDTSVRHDPADAGGCAAAGEAASEMMPARMNGRMIMVRQGRGEDGTSRRA
jgi:hypothetical protein